MKGITKELFKGVFKRFLKGVFVTVEGEKPQSRYLKQEDEKNYNQQKNKNRLQN